jgi:hypothetical protein
MSRYEDSEVEGVLDNGFAAAVTVAADTFADADVDAAVVAKALIGVDRQGAGSVVVDEAK